MRLLKMSVFVHANVSQYIYEYTKNTYKRILFNSQNTPDFFLIIVYNFFI
jgi:hypothetical protein